MKIRSNNDLSTESDLGRSNIQVWDEIHLTISKVDLELIDFDGENENRPVVYFNKIERILLLDCRSGWIISKIHGNETDSWIGKNVILRVTEKPVPDSPFITGEIIDPDYDDYVASFL